MQEYIDFVSKHPVLFGLFTFILVLLVVGELRRRATGAKSLQPMHATQLMNQDNCSVVDVRPTAEYKQGHIIGATNLVLSEVAEKAERISKDKSAPVLVYCKNGTQAPSAAKQLQQAGFEQVYLLAGGLMSWQAESMPLEK